jgi:hypothetical protein
VGSGRELFHWNGSGGAFREKFVDEPRNQLTEFNTHSFVIKLWFDGEDRGSEGEAWRGYITHVSSGTRHYLKNLGDIPSFIEPYLAAWGTVTPPRRGIGRWLKLWKR